MERKKEREKEIVGHGFCFILAQIQGCTRSRERRLARNEIQPPTTSTPYGGKRKKKRKERRRRRREDRDESIRAWRETETVNYRTGTRQSREPVGHTSSRINRAKSIVRRGEQNRKKKEKETRANKKNRFPAWKSNYSSPFREHCGETINKIRSIARKPSILSLMTIQDEVFKNLFSRIPPFFVFFSFFFLLFRTLRLPAVVVDRKYSVEPGERLSRACSFPNLFHRERFGFGVDTKWREREREEDASATNAA